MFLARFREGPLDPEKARRWGQRRCSELLLVGSDGLAGKWKEGSSPDVKNARQQLFGNLRNWKVQPLSYDALTEQQYSELQAVPVSLEECAPATAVERKRARGRAAALPTSRPAAHGPGI